MYIEYKLKPNGVADDRLLEICIEKGLTLVTRDQGLILKANKMGVDIIFAHGNDDLKWSHIPKEIKMRNRLKLIKYSLTNYVTNERDLDIIPSFISRKRGQVDF